MRFEKIIVCFITFAVGLAPFMAQGQTFSVNTVTELTTALSTAESNGEDDTINISAGTYTLSSLLSYDSTEDKAITLQSSGGTVILDGNNVTQILYLNTGTSNTSNATVTVTGITFKNGFMSDTNKIGSELYVFTQNADITVNNSEFHDGRVSALFEGTNGGSAYLRISSGGTISLTDSAFYNNYAKGIGGGPYIMGGFGTTVELINNIFSANEATTQGGGFYISVIEGTVNLINNTLNGNDNSAGNGNGGGGGYLRLYNDANTANIYNNIIWGNTAGTGIGADLYIEDDGDTNGTGATVNIYNNDYSDIDINVGNNLVSSNNIDQDPLLTSDFHITSNSPCFDTGNAAAPSLPANDFEGDTRQLGLAPDMGADEYLIPIPTLSEWGIILLVALLLAFSLLRLEH